MDAILKLPYELQIAFVSGYLAYKIISIGKGRAHRTEDFLLQVLTFGVLSRATIALLGATSTAPQYLQVDSWPEAALIAAIATMTCIIAVLYGAIWRLKGEAAAKAVMYHLGVYNDDHEASAWQSIMQKPAKWTVLQVHLDSGIVLESNFGRMNPQLRHPIVMNEDGIGMYVTGRYTEDGHYDDWDITGSDSDVTLTYIPRASIKQLDIAWQLPQGEILNKV